MIIKLKIISLIICIILKFRKLNLFIKMCMNDVNMQEIGCRCNAYLYSKNKIYPGTVVPAIKSPFESHITCIISSTEHF